MVPAARIAATARTVSPKLSGAIPVDIPRYYGGSSLVVVSLLVVVAPRPPYLPDCIEEDNAEYHRKQYNERNENGISPPRDPYPLKSILSHPVNHYSKE